VGLANEAGLVGPGDVPLSKQGDHCSCSSPVSRPINVSLCPKGCVVHRAAKQIVAEELGEEIDSFSGPFLLHHPVEGYVYRMLSCGTTRDADLAHSDPLTGPDNPLRWARVEIDDLYASVAIA
jgi:hypothetical protein